MPLYFAPERGSPQVRASATLIEYKNEKYLVTAGHVSKLEDEFGPPFIPVRQAAEPDKSAITQFATFQTMTTRDEGAFQLDIKFLHLLDEPLYFPTFSSFLTETDFGDDALAEYFFVVGFAASKNKRPKNIPAGRTIKKPSSTMLHVERHPNGRRILDGLGYHRDNHIVVSYNGRYQQGAQQIHGPKPHGISGGALYGIKKTASGLEAFLCGIATEYRKGQQAMICTSLRLVLGLLQPYRNTR